MHGMYGVYTLRSMKLCKVTRAEFESMARDDPKRQQVIDKIRELQQQNLANIIKR